MHYAMYMSTSTCISKYSSHLDTLSTVACSSLIFATFTVRYVWWVDTYIDFWGAADNILHFPPMNGKCVHQYPGVEVPQLDRKV